MKLFRGQPEGNAWRRELTNAEKAKMWWGFAFLFALMSWIEWGTPSAPPFHGKLALLQSVAFSVFGVYGTVYLFILAAIFMLIAGCHYWSGRV